MKHSTILFVVETGMLAIGFGYAWHAWNFDIAISVSAFVIFLRSGLVRW